MEDNDKTDWLPVSDLMSGLMLIFMLIAILFARAIINKKQDSRQQCMEIYNALWEVFEQDFDDWNADLLDDLTVRFNTDNTLTPRIFFLDGKSRIEQDFKNILKIFYPKYIVVLKQQNNKGNIIQSLRIEGHTSSKWQNMSKDDAYFKNMALSQSRARETLRYVLNETVLTKKNRKWAMKLTTANGLSSSKLIRNQDGTENENKSRRVEFKAIATACQLAGINNDE